MPVKTESKQGKTLASSKGVNKAPAKKSMTKTTTGNTQEVASKKAAPKSRKKIAAPVQARTDLDVDYFRDLLLTERERYDAELEGIRSRTNDVEGSLPDEGESGDEDTADLAAAMMDKEIDLSVEDEIMDLLNAIDHAVEKI
jgi:hypothetical protein